MPNSRVNWLSQEMRIYVLRVISRRREIRCEKCGAYENLEMHHTKYAPTHTVSVDDIQLLCSLCHRNSKNSLSKVGTIFENGKRYCVGSKFKFEY